jgi:hypothetical protein
MRTYRPTRGFLLDREPLASWSFLVDRNICAAARWARARTGRTTAASALLGHVSIAADGSVTMRRPAEAGSRRPLGRPVGMTLATPELINMIT